ncbi:MAG: hypothetical protein K6T31_08010, partial [Alicyclobacillus sp.]|nr:hypothetical protein [Alicyclobacillus sp.]
VLLTFLPELLRFIKEYYMAIYGLGIVLVVLFMPQGIVPVVGSLWRRWRRRPTQTPSQPSGVDGGQDACETAEAGI